MKQVKKLARSSWQDEPLEPLLTIPDIEKLLQVSRRTVYNLIDRGLPTMKLGKSVRIHPADFRRWLAGWRAA